MTAIIVGISHELQRAQDTGEQDRRHYEREIESIIRSHGIEACLEEALHGERSMTEAFCIRREIPYVNIDMPPQERDAQGIKRIQCFPELGVFPSQKEIDHNLHL